MEYPKISVVIGSYNRYKPLMLCIEAVREELTHCSYEMIVVDGGSNDGSVEWLVQQKDIVSIVQHNRGEWRGKTIERKPWAYFMNLAFKAATGKYICMLSDDTLIVPGAILNGVTLFDECLAKGQKLGAVAFYFRDYPIRKRYAVAINLGNLYVNHGLYLRDAMVDVGYCDEEYHFYFADTDVVLKMKEKGYDCIASEHSFVEHYFEATPEIRATNEDPNKQLDRSRLISKWKDIAYPAEKEEYFRKHIGCWQYHPSCLQRNDDAIRNLVVTSNNQFEGLPKISVVTVVYNDPDGLAITIDNLKSQTYPFIDYIVVDGDSDTATKDVLRKKGEPIDIIISEPDDGIYDAMNKGIEQATGEFLIYMNAGDRFVESTALERMARHLNDDADVVYGNRIYVENAEEQGLIQIARPIDQITKGMPFGHQAVFCRTTLLKEYKFNTTYKFAADYEQMVRFYTNGIRFKQVDETVCEFYGGGKSESGIRPYLECLKIQLDYFGDGKHMADSHYMRGFMKNVDSFLLKYK